ncbi:transposase [Nonomuraea phyllanthi]|uniref:Transposase n=1 Tax=Nonomuraea phyllanthi TaxID=2219224 RepID=A0A5C4WTZ1_9ACTN|nr:transposase [Nonomuraea phyllanthi]
MASFDAKHSHRSLDVARRRVDDRTILAAIVYVTTTGCAWRQVPPVFGASWQTVSRRFTEWSAARVSQAVPDPAGRARHARRSGLVAARGKGRQPTDRRRSQRASGGGKTRSPP